jgi:hypothetical protein
MNRSVDLLQLADAKTAKRRHYMSKLEFIFTVDGQLITFSKHSENFTALDEMKINVIGNYMKSQRKNCKLSKMDVAKILGYKNISKTIRNISLIEEKSCSFQGYNNRLVDIYQITQEDLSKVIQEHKKQKIELDDKRKKMKIDASIAKLNFFCSVMENLSFLLDKFEEIVKVPEYYFCPVPDSWIGSAYVARKRSKLYLGELLSLWEKGEWLGVCPECGNIVYLTNAGGSPLSGRGGAWGICCECKQMKYEIKPFGKYFHQIMTYPVLDLPKDLKMLSFETMLNKLQQNKI